MILEILDLRKTFVQGENRLEILKGANLKVQTGESVAILGKSGSGKSTLLSLLAGLDHPSSGKVILQGRDLSEMSERDLAEFRARNLAIIFQQFHLISYLTALENIALPLQIRGDQSAIPKAREALKKVGLETRAGHLPSRLSGGEKQRTALARAWVVRPPLILADEPTGNLDPETGDQVMEMLFELQSTLSVAMILVTHNESLARRCSRRVRIEAGTLKAEA